MSPHTPRLDQIRRRWSFDRLKQLADKHGTPLYVTDLERVRHNYTRLNSALNGITVNYAVKANSEYSITKLLRKQGAGAECASIEEVRRAMDAGYELSEIQLTAVNPPEYVVNESTKLSAEDSEFSITVGAMDSIKRLGESGFSGEVFIRINPEVSPTNTRLSSNGAFSKFGLPYDRVENAVKTATDAGLNVVGLHAHFGGIIMEDTLEQYADLVRKTANKAMSLPLDIPKLDFGGGLGIPYEPDETSLDLELVNEKIHKNVPNSYNGELLVEPGRYIVGDAGVLLTKVNTVKKTANTRFIGVDAGMTNLVRPVMFNSYHPITNVDGPEKELIEQTVAGPTCSGADVFAYNRCFPKVSRGDVLVIGNTGAYGYVLSSYFHSFPRAASVVIDGEKEGVSMERETLQDVTRPENKPEWV